jgi:hypothetical protein
MQAILFLDDWMVERRTCLERVWGKPRFVKELFIDFHPDVLGYGGYLSVFYDQQLGRYVMYLSVYPPEADPGTFVVRLQSDDPYDWPDPVYDLRATPVWKGFQDVVVKEDGERFWPTVVRSLAHTPLEELGYLTTCINPDRRDGNSLIGFSDDGLHFRLDREHPWQDIRSDTWSGVVWNERLRCYQIYTRPVCADRRIAIVTTSDLQNYTPSMTVLQPDAQDHVGTEMYSMPAFPYEDVYIGMLHIMMPDTFVDRRIKTQGRMETELAYGYNGVNWYRTRREPFIGVRDYGLQGGGQVYAMQMLRSRDDKLLFYVHASKGEHAAYPDMQKAGLNTRGYFGALLYDMRLDGFCSLKTSGKDGILRTKAIIPRSGEMSINVRTTEHTAIRVQLIDGDTGQPIPGYTWAEALPISGDHLFARPCWQEQEDLAELVGKPIRIEISMREAEIFAIRIEGNVFVGHTATETL